MRLQTVFDLHIGNIRKMYATMGLSPDMGTRLYSAYRAAGLMPTLKGFTRVGNATEVVTCVGHLAVLLALSGSGLSDDTVTVLVMVVDM